MAKRGDRPKPTLERPTHQNGSEGTSADKPALSRAERTRSSRNALKHYLTSNAPIIPEMESDEEYQRHLDGFMADFAPEGYVEKFYVERLASLLWRLRRVTRHEVAAIMQNILSVPGHMYTVANL